MNELDIFLSDIESQISDIESQFALSRENLMRDNQKRFEKLVKKSLRKGDKLYVANGTALLERGKRDSGTYDHLERITGAIS